MKLTVTNNKPFTATPIQAHCPNCGADSIFMPIGQNGNDLMINDRDKCGQRVCSNPSCRGHLFVIHQGGELIKSYPAITLDFNPENIPESISSTFEEALICFSQECYVASAIMVRRTLEEICQDKSAEGKNLKLRIENLSSKIIIPQELLAAMDELRLLGNDAAHLEANDFEKISKDELLVAIGITKEIMKSLYQYSKLLSDIRSLKK